MYCLVECSGYVGIPLMKYWWDFACQVVELSRVANVNPLGNHAHAILFCFPGIFVVVNVMYHIHIHGYASYQRNLVRIVPTTGWENQLYITFFMSICVTFYSIDWQDTAVSSYKTSLWDFDLDQCLYGSYWFIFMFTITVSSLKLPKEVCQ